MCAAATARTINYPINFVILLKSSPRVHFYYSSDVPSVTIKLGSSLSASDIDEGDDVYFECEVQANPKTYRLSWFKDGKELQPASNVIMPGSDSLVLQKVTRASAGEYSCVATNDEGRATSRPVSLDVMCEYN